MQFQLLYPTQRVVNDTTLIGWAQDFLEISTDIDVFYAIEVLEDAGEITIGNSGNPLDIR